ncbi:site-specific integrase [Hymenobacter sp. 15J16-1T3B]|uniref:site-specific integrase n=1 Tax=Hymenobacter sp. 15J16-1T3B TaxID=2886941 RepID=UPI001D11B2F2|nr:site-specific integrase [Hymenobacter sp. 15J16-1T3B]MCC3158660.1 site-specific integrase [Hymenobacter sp. 15J16-1T3B]
MATVSFHLKDPKSDKPTAVFIWFNADGRRTKIYTGYKVDPQQWDAGEQKAKTRGRGYSSTNGSTNDGLKLMGETLQEYYAEKRAKGLIPSEEDLRKAIEPQEEVKVEKPELLTDFAAYIDRLNTTRRPATAKSAKTTLNHLKGYSTHSKTPLDYEDLTMVFFDGFTKYLLNVPKLTDNSLNKQVTILKRFLNDAVVRGRTERQDFKRWHWKRREPDTVALTHEELAAIEELELPAKHYLDNVRGLFLLSCYTALRFSDVEALQPSNDKGDRLKVTTQKTRDSLTIPVSPKARIILDRMWAGEIHPISNQKMNAYLKELAKRAGVDSDTDRPKYRAGENIGAVAPKYQLISSHTGRRTFVTLAIKDGVPWDVIMKVTGHKDIKSFMRYVGSTEERHMDAFFSLWNKKE